MTRVLNTLGYKCDTASNGQECLNLCETKTYDVIFLDLVMPVLDGEACLKELTAKYPETDVILISVNDDEDSVDTILQAGATAYLCKPFKLEVVQTVMSQLKEKREQST